MPFGVFAKEPFTNAKFLKIADALIPVYAHINSENQTPKTSLEMKTIKIPILLLLLLLTTAAEAQFTITTNGINGVTITRYTGSGGAVNIPSTINGSPVMDIGFAAFAGLTNVTSVTISNGPISIDNYAFEKCCLTNISIPSSVTTIGIAAFAFCQNLANVTIPGSVVSVGSGAFNFCTNLTDVSIADGVVNIASNAMMGCAMTNITIPASLTNLDRSAFNLCENLTAITVLANNPVYSSDAGILFNQDGTVLLLCPEGESGSYTIPDRVIAVGDLAFYNCCLLTNVVYGKNVTSIGDLAFQWSPLANATIPASVTNIGFAPFDGCENLTAIMVDPANPAYTALGGVLFNRNQNLLMEFPGGISGGYAVPDGVTSIGDYAFGDCQGLTNIIMDSNLLNIGNFAFVDCAVLTSIVIPDAVTNLGGFVFGECWGLTNCELGASLSRIGANAFSDCGNLTDIVVPDSVNNIGDNAFQGCGQLSHITLGNGITNIGDYVFSECALTNITLPANLVSIGSSDFGDCWGLGDIYFKGNAPSVPFLSSWEGYLLGCNAPCYYLPGTTGWTSLPFAHVWDPKMQTQSATFGVRTNQFGFTITASTNLTVVVQGCADLSHPNWQPLQTLTLANKTAYFSDPQWTNAAGRFYRLSSP